MNSKLSRRSFNSHNDIEKKIIQIRNKNGYLIGIPDLFNFISLLQYKYRRYLQKERSFDIDIHKRR